MEDTDVPAAASVATEVDRAAVFCDPKLVKQYLRNLVPLLLGSSSQAADDSDLDAVEAMLSFPETTDKCQAFANDPSVPVLYVIKDVEAAAPEAEQSEIGFSTATFALSFELLWSSTHAGSIALIKRAQTLDPSVSVTKQIQVMNLPGPAHSGATASQAADGAAHSSDASAAAGAGPKERSGMAVMGSTNPYEALHAYVRFAVSPYFNAYVTAKEQAEQQASHAAGATGDSFRDDKDLQQQGIPMAKKKLAELELSLLHLQQNMDIPDVVLNIHPVIARTVADCRSQGIRTTVDAVDPALL
ncbi:dynein heavy chain, partial [Coemansia sp. RSA 486]